MVCVSGNLEVGCIYVSVKKKVVECQNQKSSIRCTSAAGCREHGLAKKVGKNDQWPVRHESDGSVLSTSAARSKYAKRSNEERIQARDDYK